MRTVTIGRSRTNDVVIQDTFVSGSHCTITQEDNGNYFLRDLGSSNGTYVNGKQITQAYLQFNDIVKIGETILPWRAYFTASGDNSAKGNIVTKLTIGRATDNNIVLHDEFVSSHHAELLITDQNECIVHDLNSTNGTFVNDMRIVSSRLLPGDRLRLAKSSFDWLPYINMPSGGPVRKAKRRKKPWILTSIIAGIVIVLALIAWGVTFFIIEQKPGGVTDSIHTDTTTTVHPGALSQMVKYIEKSVFLVKTFRSRGATMQGTGFFIDEYGLGITNNHVIEGGNRWVIRTIDEREYEITEFLERNKEYDFAVFRINNKGQTFNWLKRSKSAPLKGDEIFVLGNPQGMESTLTKGIVSSLRGGDEDDMMHGRFTEGNSFIQIDVAVSHGSSGSPVMNMIGEVVGMATLSFQEANCINCNFAVNSQKFADYMKVNP